MQDYFKRNSYNDEIYIYISFAENYSERIIMSFSLRRTIKTLLKKTMNGTDITCIHGIRTLTTVILYIGHQLMIISRLPLSNRIFLTEVRKFAHEIRL